MEILRKTKSLCPRCLEVIPAEIVDDSGIVKIRKNCPDHGGFEDVYWSNSEHYKHFVKFKKEGSKVDNPRTKSGRGCPYDCGICGEHKSHTILGIVDVTNRCNMNCPICFANANAAGYLYEPTKEQIKEMLENLRNNIPVPTPAVQFSGGEPTMRDDLPELVEIANDLGFLNVEVDTNGIRCAGDIHYLKRLKDAGTHTFYLQFDGLDDDAAVTLRGRAMKDVRKKFIENCRKVGFKSVVLVVALTKGVNDSQLGDIVNFAVENYDVVRCINIQPISFAGRASKMEVKRNRITTYDFISLMEEQTHGKLKKEYFYPVPSMVPVSRFVEVWRGEKKPVFSTHPYCGVATYIVVDGNGGYTPINEIVDIDALLTTLEGSAEKLKARSQIEFISERIYRAKKLKVKVGVIKEILKNVHNPRFRSILTDVLKKGSFDALANFHGKVIMVSCMHFMDAWNFDLERLERCVIHYSLPDGRIIPFCSYNTIHREGVEIKNAEPLAGRMPERGSTTVPVENA